MSTKLIGGRWRPTGRILGGGGQAQVLVVTDETGKFTGEWAAKVLRDERRIDRIEREVETARRLFERGAPVIEVVDDYIRSEPGASRAWFVMPIAEHGSLGRSLESQPIYGGSVISALTLFRDITAAVLQFHKENVAHRDLKPDNILLTAGYKPQLADLGLCLPLGDAEGERLTGVLERIGSLHYLPKEAFGRGPLDQNQFAFDAYALGKVLYQMTSGRVLPGFTSPTDPHFDLTKQENSPLFRGVSRAVRGLLHDTPAVRLETLSQLEEQIGDLLEAVSEEKPSGTGAKEILLKAAGALASQLVTPPAPPVSPDLQYELNSIRDEIFVVWLQSPVLAEIEEVLVQPNSDRLEIVKEGKNRTVRSLLVGPGVNTRRALEPIEDLGFPSFPTGESDCAIKVSGKGETLKMVSSTYLCALVGSSKGRVMVATVVIVCSPDSLGPRDIVPGTSAVADVTVHDAGLGVKLRTIADAAMQQFATTLADQISRNR